MIPGALFAVLFCYIFLVASTVASPMVRDTLQLVNYFGVGLRNASGKFKLLYENSNDTESDTASTAPVRTSNRWTVQHDGLFAVNVAFGQYVERHSRIHSLLVRSSEISGQA